MAFDKVVRNGNGIESIDVQQGAYKVSERYLEGNCLPMDRPGTMQESYTTIEKMALGLVLAMSLFLRMCGLDVFITVDEPTWRTRSINFQQALADHSWEKTYQSEHPGVVTMWSGVLASRLAEAAGASDLTPDLIRRWPRAEISPARGPFYPVTLWARRIIAFTTWVGIVIASLLLRRAFDRHSALIATTFIALDPFCLFHSRLHHLDGLLTTFVMLSVVSLLVYTRGRRRPGYLVLSAVTAGLAIANKSPGLFLVPWTGVVLLLGAWRNGGVQQRRNIVRATGPLLLWGGVAAITIVVIWPALWVEPVDTIHKVLSGALGQGLNPHENSNFFWGQVRPDPGPAFYPVAWAFRTTPLVIFGLASLAVWGRGRDLKDRGMPLFLFVVGYSAFMTLAAKKFDRYLLPIFPLVDILAAAGFSVLPSAGLWLRGIWRRSIPVVIVALLAFVQFALLWPSRPYYSAYYNPMLGGTATAPRVLLVGWGEGLEKAAAYLNEKPGAKDLHVAIQSFGEFRPFFVGKTTLAGWAPLPDPDYFVLYASHVQRWFTPEIVSHFKGEPAEYVAVVNGLEYAWVYPNTFYRKEALDILDDIAAQGHAETDQIILDTDAALRRYYRGPLEFSVIAGVARDDFVLGELERAARGRDRLWHLTLPDAGEETGAIIRRHLEASANRVQTIQVGEVAATCYELDIDTRFVSNPTIPTTARLGEDIRLIGYDLQSNQFGPERPFAIRFYWRASGPTRVSYKVFTHLLGPDGQMYGQMDSIPQGGARPTTIWTQGEMVIDDYVIALAEGAPEGEYRLAFGMYDLDTMKRLPAYDQTGQRLPEDRILIEGLSLSRVASQAK